MASVEVADVAGQGQHGDAAARERGVDGLLEQVRQLLGARDGLANTATSANSASLSTSWKKSLPISALGTWPQMASTGACDFLAS